MNMIRKLRDSRETPFATLEKRPTKIDTCNFRPNTRNTHIHMQLRFERTQHIHMQLRFERSIRFLE